MLCKNSHDLKSIAIDKLTGRQVAWCERCGAIRKGNKGAFRFPSTTLFKATSKKRPKR